MIKTIIKIDACDSKSFVAGSRLLDSQTKRQLLFKKLGEVAKEHFPDTDRAFPDGAIYSGQGDCLYLILDNPDFALRSCVEFMKKWFEHTSSFPDCRAVIDIEDVAYVEDILKIELISEGLENLNIIEKTASSGEIYVTSNVQGMLRNRGAFTFVEKGPVSIAARTLEVFRLNYENPRTINEEYLVEAVFISDERADSLRDRSISLLVLNYLLAHGGQAQYLELVSYLKDREHVELAEDHLQRILTQSDIVSLTTGLIEIKEERKAQLAEIKSGYDTQRAMAIESIGAAIGTAVRMEPGYVLESINVAQMLEKYLQAVFYEIKMMGFYYNGKNSFYARLTNYSDFDVALKREFEVIRKLTVEEFSAFKRAFLSGLAKLSNEGNRYVASVFHNILVNYYLGRNANYFKAQVARLRGKTFYIDTNFYYSYRCSSSQYNIIAKFILDKLHAFEAPLRIFDRSVLEFNDSLDTTLKIYRYDDFLARNSEFIPWILLEYLGNTGKYDGRFEACVREHKLDPTTCEIKVKGNSIITEKLEPYLQPADIQELFDLIHELKSWNRSNIAGGPNSQVAFDAKVLHDANCIHRLGEEVENPMEAKAIFLTCDFRLARLRNRKQFKFNNILTVHEMYEFMLPYLLIDENLVGNPVTIPNMLLASAIDIELSSTDSLEQSAARYLTHADLGRDYQILNSIKQRERLGGIAERLTKSIREHDKEGYNAATHQFEVAQEDYVQEVGDKLGQSLTAETLKKQRGDIEKMKAEIEELRIRNEVLGKRKVGEKKYDKRMAKRSGK